MKYGPGNAIDFNQIQRVLVVKLRHHGDVLLTSPLFQVLKNHFPHLEVDALVYQETLPMLAFHPAIHQVHCIDRTQRKQGTLHYLKYEWQLARNLKKRSYDLIIHLTESWRGAMLCRLLKPRYAITKKYGRRQSRFWLNSFTHHYPIPVKLRHTVEMHLDALRRVGLQPDFTERKLVVDAGQEAKHTLKTKLEQAGISQNDTEKNGYIVVHPTSRWLFKCWSVSAMAIVINQLMEQGHKVVLSAAPDKNEMSMIADIKGRLRRPTIDFSGQLSLYELIALIDGAKLMIGVDSVPMHIAAATQTPVIALFGPSGNLEWGPWQVAGEVITSKKHSCRPCGLDGCAGSKISDCLQQIPAKRVLDSAFRLLNPIDTEMITVSR